MFAWAVSSRLIGDYDIIIPSYLPYMSVIGLKPFSSYNYNSLIKRVRGVPVLGDDPEGVGHVCLMFSL